MLTEKEIRLMLKRAKSNSDNPLISEKANIIFETEIKLLQEILDD